MNAASNSTKPSFLAGSADNNLDVSAASYLGGSGDDSASAVDISLDGRTVIVGGQTPNHSPGGQQFNLLGGGDGLVMRYDSQTNRVLSSTRLPGRVRDLEVNPQTGEIVIAYGSGIALLSADASKVIWSKSLANAERVAISGKGNVAVLQKSADKVTLYSKTGSPLQNWSGKGRSFQDVAISDQDGGAVVITGFKQARSNLQVAFTRAWTYDGRPRWTAYDHSAQEVDAVNLLADTRGERVAFGRDGKLYSANWINGGTGYSIFSREPNNLRQNASSKTVVTDRYTNAFNTGTVAMTWFGEYDLKTGGLVKGQSLLTRRSKGQGNSITPDAITADEKSNIYLSGNAFASLENRDDQRIEGQRVSGYGAKDGFLAIISPDLKTRYAWTPISKAKGTAVAVRDGVAAVVTTTNFEGRQITDNPIQGKAGGKDDGYFLILGGRDVPAGSSPTPAPTPTPAPQPPIGSGSPIRIEAESLKLNGYQAVSQKIAQASGGKFISLKTSGEDQGTAQGVFRGPAGRYQVRVGYYDENDGRSAATFSTGGKTQRWVFDQNLPSNWVNANNKASRVVDTVTLKSGDAFTLTGQREGGEYARFDYVDFLPVEPDKTPGKDPVTGNPAPKPTNPTPLSIRAEAESLKLNGYGVQSGVGEASGGRLISLKASGARKGTAQGTFQGPEGRYQIQVGYYDESDGRSKASLSIGGQTKSWVFDQNIDAVGTTQVVDEMLLKPGDAFTLTGEQQAGEYARFDYVDFIRVGSTDRTAGTQGTAALGETALEKLTVASGLTASSLTDLTGEVNSSGF